MTSPTYCRIIQVRQKERQFKYCFNFCARISILGFHDVTESDFRCSHSLWCYSSMYYEMGWEEVSYFNETQNMKSLPITKAFPSPKYVLGRINQSINLGISLPLPDNSGCWRSLSLCFPEAQRCHRNRSNTKPGLNFHVTETFYYIAEFDLKRDESLTYFLSLNQYKISLWLHCLILFSLIIIIIIWPTTTKINLSLKSFYICSRRILRYL